MRRGRERDEGKRRHEKDRKIKGGGWEKERERGERGDRGRDGRKEERSERMFGQGKEEKDRRGWRKKRGRGRGVRGEGVNNLGVRLALRGKYMFVASLSTVHICIPERERDRQKARQINRQREREREMLRY